MAKRMVLVVDDDPAVLESLGLIVEHMGHRVETATSGLEALGKLAASSVDLVLTDSRMAGMDGYAFAKEAKRRHPTVPIVLVTGSTTARASSDIDCRIQKPFSFTQLSDAISRLTELQSK